MKITLIQMKSDGNKKENEEKTFGFLNKAIKNNPDIICLSELFLSWGKDFDSGIIDIDDKEIVRVNNWNEIYDEVEKYKNNL